MNFQRRAICFLLVALSAGCQPDTDDAESKAPPQATDASKSERVPAASLPVAQKRVYTPYVVTTHVADMSKGALGFRLSTAIVESEGPIWVMASLFNNTKEPIRVLKPFGDAYGAASTIEIYGPRGRCEYVGKIPDYSLGEDSFAIAKPGVYLTDIFRIEPKLFSNFGETGVYDIRYRYRPVTDIEVSAGPVRTQLGRDRNYRGESTIERLALFEFEQPRYRFTQVEAARGNAFKYDLVVRADTPPLALFRHSECSGNNLGSGGLLVFEELAGNGQRYAWDNCGLGFFPETEAKPVSAGRYTYTMKWEGRNWGGPSCTNHPLGPPFPVGEYTLTVSMWGVVEESDGARFFRIDGKAPVEIVP